MLCSVEQQNRKQACEDIACRLAEKSDACTRRNRKPACEESACTLAVLSSAGARSCAVKNQFIVFNGIDQQPVIFKMAVPLTFEAALSSAKAASVISFGSLK